RGFARLRGDRYTDRLDFSGTGEPTTMADKNQNTEGPEDPAPPAPAPAEPIRTAMPTAAESDAEGLSQFGRFIKTYWSQILLVILIPIVLFRGIRYFQEKDAIARESAYVELENARFSEKTPSATRFIDLADKHNDVTGYQARTLLLAAEVLLADGLGASEEGAILTVNDRQQRLEQAEKHYTRITRLPSRTQLQEIKARFGLAAIAETRGYRGEEGAFETAARIYREIEKLAGEQWPLQAAEARTRRESLEKLDEKLPFPKKRKTVTLEDLKPEPKSETPVIP
ncbi:MAG: hypothetical protein R3236_03355, partial [Phycisphaeraceae bacterium]|nr:hypothetical protein [Phycisphaeraceae bacterium]